MIILIIVPAVLLLIAVGFGVTQVASLKSEVNEARLQNEELQLQNEQLQPPVSLICLMPSFSSMKTRPSVRQRYHSC